MSFPAREYCLITLGIAYRRYRQRHKLVEKMGSRRWVQYLFLSTGGVDAGQARSVQEPTVMELDTDEVSSTVEESAHQNITTGQVVTHLQIGNKRRHFAVYPKN
jgi:hypothetical protein